MQYVPRFTHLATRLRDGVTIVIPHRRYRRGTTETQREVLDSFTLRANEKAAEARRAADRQREEQDIIALNRKGKEAL